MNNTATEQVIAGKMTRSKEIAVVAFLIAIGAVLRMFSPAILGITPNFIIAMYCLSILLIRPKIGAALGIGIVAGAVSMIFSKSPIPYLNLATEPAGALACVLLATYLPELSIKQYSFKPAVAIFLGTLVSGGLYVVLNFHLALHLPLAAMQGAFVGVVIPVALINTLIGQALYAPVRKFLFH